MSSPVSAVSSSSASTGLLASLRQIGTVLAAKVRQVAGSVRVAAARVAQYVGGKLAIPATTVVPLALVALVIVALVIASRA